MSATREIDADARPEVPTMIGHLVSAFDFAYGTLDEQLGSTVRLRKKKTKTNPPSAELQRLPQCREAREGRQRHP